MHSVLKEHSYSTQQHTWQRLACYAISSDSKKKPSQYYLHLVPVKMRMISRKYWCTAAHSLDRYVSVIVLFVQTSTRIECLLQFQTSLVINCVKSEVSTEMLFRRLRQTNLSMFSTPSTPHLAIFVYQNERPAAAVTERAWKLFKRLYFCQWESTFSACFRTRVQTT
jgi:hypothetical protein